MNVSPPPVPAALATLDSITMTSVELSVRYVESIGDVVIGIEEPGQPEVPYPAVHVGRAHARDLAALLRDASEDHDDPLLLHANLLTRVGAYVDELQAGGEDWQVSVASRLRGMVDPDGEFANPG